MNGSMRSTVSLCPRVSQPASLANLFAILYNSARFSLTQHVALAKTPVSVSAAGVRQHRREPWLQGQARAGWQRGSLVSIMCTCVKCWCFIRCSCVTVL